MGSDAITTKLCSTCSQHTLQSLYWGTDNYPLSKDCDLCGLIWESLGSNPELLDSDGTLPMINICAARKRGFRSQARCGIWASHDTRKDELRSLLGSIATKLKTPPISLLDVYTAQKEHVMSIKTKPLHGKYPRFNMLAHHKLTGRFSDSRSALSSHVSGRGIQPAASNENIEMIRGWISSCVTGHSGCRRSLGGRTLKDNKKPQRLPTRLIEVTPKVRLRETAGQRGQYLALSYCWGTGTQGSQTPNTVTTQANIDSFYDDVPLDALAPTVRDAILLVQRLGFRYLWVDALCIIQGDAADWERESRQMAQIFENALCTIVALGADHAGEGLFLSGNDSPPPEAKREAIIPCRSDNKTILGYASVTAWTPPDEEARRSPVRDFSDARWSRRAWVLQERMLSRRMLYFGRGQIYWTCMERMIHEDGIDHEHAELIVCNPHALKSLFFALTLVTPIGYIPILGQVCKLLLGNKHTTLQEIWDILLIDYSNCELTVESDKLMAIAGLASALSQRSGMTYFEGIWVEMACFGLTWKAESASEFPTNTNIGHGCGKIAPCAIAC